MAGGKKSVWILTVFQKWLCLQGGRNSSLPPSPSGPCLSFFAANEKKVDVDLGAGTETGGRANRLTEGLNSAGAYWSVYFYTTTLNEQ